MYSFINFISQRSTKKALWPTEMLFPMTNSSQVKKFFKGLCVSFEELCVIAYIKY